MNKDIHFRELELEDLPQLQSLMRQLNPKKDESKMIKYQKEMLNLSNYFSFVIEVNDQIVGVSSCWVSIKWYSGRQLEIDNFVIDEVYRSQGLGGIFIDLLEEWAIENNCKTIELNAYVRNAGAHKFYFDKGYHIIGFHFQKTLK